MLHYALSSAQATCPGNVCLVVGHKAHEIRAAAAGLADHIVINEDYADGIGSSIARGVRAMREQSKAIIIMPADQPLVSPVHLARLVEMWAGGPSEIIASRYSGICGPPVLFADAMFEQLENLVGDTGARELLRANPDMLRTVECEEAAVDIDTRAEFEALTKGHRARF